MSAATSQACDCAFDPADTGEVALAIWTSVEILVSTMFDGEGEAMTAFLAADPKVVAGLLPFEAMWQDATPPDAKLREQMRQLMTQRAIDLGRMLKQPWV